MMSPITSLVALLWGLFAQIVHVGPCEIDGGIRPNNPYNTTQRPGTSVSYYCDEFAWQQSPNPVWRTRMRFLPLPHPVRIVTISMPNDGVSFNVAANCLNPEFIPDGLNGSISSGRLNCFGLYPWNDTGTYTTQHPSKPNEFFITQGTQSRTVSVAAAPVCPNVDNTVCQSCAWPYSADLDPSECVCRVNYNRLQPYEILLSKCKVWCQTAGDDGSQYYYDPSRTRINDKVAECACSSPMAGKTIYMPAQQCPEGSKGVYFDGLNDGDTGQIFNPDVPDNRAGNGTGSGGASDTGIYYTRLDTILDRLYEINTYSVLIGNTLDSMRRLMEKGDGGGPGTDTGTHRRLDDIMAFMDTSGNSSYDSIRNRIGYVLDSMSNDTFDIKLTIDTLMGIINTHSSRGDTSQYDGITLDSMLNFCITMPIQDSTYCLRDTVAWPYIGPWFQWIRRMILVFWGFVCAGIFLGIAHGVKDD